MNRIDIGNFRRALISWGSENFRYFPWRQTDDAYRILIAEIMLHRTQAPQVVPVYLRFIERYPDLELLARAERKELHQFLYPLGLRWRIDAMHLQKDLTVRFPLTGMCSFRCRESTNI